MMKVKFLANILVTVLLLSASTTGVIAQQSESSSYQLEEVFIGPGGTLDSNSTNYNLRGTLGDTGVGENSSPGYNLLAGYTTDAAPTLIFQVNSSAIDLGLLTTSQTKTGTSSFSVGSYNSEGYVVQTTSPGPTNSGYELNNLTTAASSQVGAEQFGINLVANTSPTSFGANPVQIPDPSFSFGYAASGYDTANQYRYNQGDVIARSDQSSGITDYTVSYIANISNTTPGGEYRMEHFMVATATF